MAIEYLQPVDYVIIIGCLILTSAFGLYYGIHRTNSKGTSTFEYILASKDMGMVPIAFSYFASLTSSGVIIGYPAEVYSFGMQIILLTITVVPCTFVLNEIFLPVFHRLNSGSVYELTLRMSATHFLGTWDYVVICVAVTLSSAFGLFFGSHQHGHRKDEKDVETNTTLEYLLAGRQMGMVPVALSYFATIASTGVVIGYPSEVYAFGSQVILIVLAVIPVTVVVNKVFLPVYQSLKSASLYEYLEIRYSTTVKDLVTAFAVFQTIALSSANIYGPSTVLSRVTGLNVWIIASCLCGLCLIYTTLGGIKAVIFADVIQAVLIFVSIVILLVGGLVHVGGLTTVYKRNFATQRLDIFNFDFNPSVRQTVWSAFIGYFFFFLALTTTSQFAIQRFMTTPSVEVARRANILGNALFILTVLISQSLGLVAYATFHGCDPIKSGSIQNMDQLVPAFVMKTLNYPALPGFIFTGILCASLSTLSSIYNSTATIFFLSFVKPLRPNMTEATSTFICKLLAFSVGILSLLGVLIVELFPNVVQSMISMFSAVSAPLLGLLLIGIFLPQANKRIACGSFLFSVLVMVWIITGSLLQKPTLDTKPLMVDNCPNNFTMSTVLNPYSDQPTNLTSYDATSVLATINWTSYFPLSSISFMWYSTVGTMCTLIVFAIASIFRYGVVRLLSCQRSKTLDVTNPKASP